MERLNNSLIGKMKRYIKLKSQVGKNKNDCKDKKFTVFHAHIIIIHSAVHKSLLFRNEEKLVALLAYSSLIRVATSGFRINPYPLEVLFVFRNEEKLVAILVYSTFRRVTTSGFRIFPYSLVVVFVFRNEEKLVAILVHSSFRRIATSGFRIFP